MVRPSEMQGDPVKSVVFNLAERWRDQLPALRKGQQIVGIGRVDSITLPIALLVECELVSSPPAVPSTSTHDPSTPPTSQA
jgi:hypothetical protein